jgi:hypothetical protein
MLAVMLAVTLDRGLAPKIELAPRQMLGKTGNAVDFAE